MKTTSTNIMHTTHSSYHPPFSQSEHTGNILHFDIKVVEHIITLIIIIRTYKGKGAGAVGWTSDAGNYLSWSASSSGGQTLNMHSLYQHGPKINEDIFISIISYKGRQKIWVVNNVLKLMKS